MPDNRTEYCYAPVRVRNWLEFLLNVKFAVSQYERDLVAYRLCEGRRTATEKNDGKYVAGRKPSYPDELKAKIRNCREQGRTYTSIARLLNEQGIPTNTGKPWYPQLVRSIVGKS